jgi:hypothetical protein
MILLKVLNWFKALLRRFRAKLTRSTAPATQTAFPSLDAIPPLSQSLQPVDLRIGFIPPPADGAQITYETARKAFDDIPHLLDNWEDVVVQQVSAQLGANESHPNPDPDAIFAFHTDYAAFCMRARLAQRPRRLWQDRIAPLVDASELRLKVANATARIHRGAPLYNVGLCSFMMGDFDRALQYIAEAGLYDQALGRGPHINILLGDHPVSEQVFIKPLQSLLQTTWSPDYAASTGFALNAQELKNLLLLMSGRESDAVQAVAALHRIARTLNGPQNHGTCVVRFRALADLLHLVESFLRQFQPVPGQLKAHLDHMLAPNPAALAGRAAFKVDRDTWCTSAGCATDSIQAMNWVSSETSNHIRSAATPAGAAGAVTFFCHHFRNSLLHVNEESLVIFQNQNDSLAAAGWVLAMLRICARAKEGRFSPTHFP